jgi:hypothetical protein
MRLGFLYPARGLADVLTPHCPSLASRCHSLPSGELLQFYPLPGIRHAFVASTAEWMRVRTEVATSLLSRPISDVVPSKGT